MSTSGSSSTPDASPGTQANATPREDNLLNMEVEDEVKKSFLASNLSSGGSSAPGSGPKTAANADAKGGNPGDGGETSKTAKPLNLGPYTMRRSSSAESVASVASSVSF